MPRMRWHSSFSLPDINQYSLLKGFSRKRRFVFVVLVIIMFLTIAIMVVEMRLSPVIRMWAQTRVVNLATQAINSAVKEALNDGLNMERLTRIINDSQGNLQAIMYDTGEINRLSAQVTQLIQLKISNFEQEHFSVPIGQLTGLDVLATWGPGIPARIMPIGAVRTIPMSSFESAGINQTLHRVFLDIEIDMRVAVPLEATDVAIKSQVPIIEEVIIGSVPSWYFAPNAMVGGFSTSNDQWSAGQPIQFQISHELSGR